MYEAPQSEQDRPSQTEQPGGPYTTQQEQKINAAVFEMQGRRRNQEDAVAMGNLEGFSQLSENNKTALLKETVAALQNSSGQEQSGSTLIASVIDESNIYTAHVGDSTAYLVTFNPDGSVAHFERLNQNLHNPDPEKNAQEYTRVKAKAAQQGIQPPFKSGRDQEGPWRLSNPKSSGALTVTRAMGDSDFHEAGLSSEPEISLVSYQDKIPQGGKGLVILACDGLTEGMSEAQLKDLIAQNHDKSPEQLAEILAVQAYHGDQNNKDATQRYQPSGDNISVMVTTLSASASPKALALFDGHNGAETAQRLSANFLPTLKALLPTQTTQPQYQNQAKWSLPQVIDWLAAASPELLVKLLDNSWRSWWGNLFSRHRDLNDLSKKLAKATGHDLTRLALAHADSPAVLERIFDRKRQRRFSLEDLLYLVAENHPAINTKLTENSQLEGKIASYVHSLLSKTGQTLTEQDILTLLAFYRNETVARHIGGYPTNLEKFSHALVKFLATTSDHNVHKKFIAYHAFAHEVLKKFFSEPGNLKDDLITQLFDNIIKQHVTYGDENLLEKIIAVNPEALLPKLFSDPNRCKALEAKPNLLLEIYQKYGNQQKFPALSATMQTTFQQFSPQTRLYLYLYQKSTQTYADNLTAQFPFLAAYDYESDATAAMTSQVLNESQGREIMQGFAAVHPNILLNKQFSEGEIQGFSRLGIPGHAYKIFALAIARSDQKTIHAFVQKYRGTPQGLAFLHHIKEQVDYLGEKNDNTQAYISAYAAALQRTEELNELKQDYAPLNAEFGKEFSHAANAQVPKELKKELKQEVGQDEINTEYKDDEDKTDVMLKD